MFGECFVGDEVLDQFDDLETLPGGELEKSSQQAETLDRAGRGGAELEMQFSRETEVFHLAPITGSALRVGHWTPGGGPDAVTERHGDDELWDRAPQQAGALSCRSEPTSAPSREVAIMSKNNPSGKPNRKI